MSAVLVLDREGSTDSEMWNASSGVFGWVVEFVAGRVRDPELADELGKFLAEGYRWLALSYYSADRGREIVRVLREELPGVAPAEFPGADQAGLRELVGDLVEMADRWAGRG